MSLFQKAIKQVKKITLPKFTKNFYFITGLSLFVWMLFFDVNDFISQYKWKRKYERLLKEKAYYEELNNSLKQQIKDYNKSENFEKFAREKHLLQKPNEDIFIIVEEKEKE
jgi:cell division protein FtsB